MSFPNPAQRRLVHTCAPRQALNNAKLYENGRLGLDLNFVRMAEMLLSALVHSLILFMVMMLAFSKMDTVNANDYYTFGTSVFTWLIVAMNYRVIFVTSTINLVFVAALGASLVTYMFFLGVYCRVQWLSPWMYNVDQEMIQEPLFWIGLRSRRGREGAESVGTSRARARVGVSLASADSRHTDVSRLPWRRGHLSRSRRRASTRC